MQAHIYFPFPPAHRRSRRSMGCNPANKKGFSVMEMIAAATN